MVVVVETKEVVGTKAVAVEAADAVVAEREAVVAVAVVENANAIVVGTKVVVTVAAVQNANARMKAKMTNPEKVEPDQYHTPQSCMLISLSQMVASCPLIVKPESLKRI